jgi:hypothetical protein
MNSEVKTKDCCAAHSLVGALAIPSVPPGVLFTSRHIEQASRPLAMPPQERIRIPDDKMDYYKDLAEMYVGDDVSPDFYGWVFPKYDHVAVGTGTVVNKGAIKQYQQATRDRSKVCVTCGCHAQL